MESCKKLLPLVWESYSSGARLPVQKSSAASGVGFDLLLDAALSTRLPLSEQLLIRFVSTVRARGLSAARNNHLIEAQQALDEGRRVLKTNSLSTEGKLIGKTFHHAVEAYLEYKRGNMSLARTHVRNALEIDGRLITQYGYNILDLHRVQLGHNLMRVDIHCGNLVAAAEMCASLIGYLEGRADQWPLPEFQIETDPSQLPPDLVSAMTAQILGELALCLAVNKRKEGRRMFAPMIRHVQSPPAAPCSRQKRAHLWLQAKWAYVNEEWTSFLELVMSLLQEGPGEMLLLWRAAVVDLFDLCCALEGEEADRLRSQILLDSQLWTHVPHQLRMRVALPAAA